MKCPYCGKEMVRGCIEGDGRGSLIWIAADENGDVDWLPTEFSILEKAHFFRKTRLECNQCVLCRKIIIDVKE